MDETDALNAAGAQYRANAPPPLFSPPDVWLTSKAGATRCRSVMLVHLIPFQAVLARRNRNRQPAHVDQPFFALAGADHDFAAVAIGFFRCRRFLCKGRCRRQ